LSLRQQAAADRKFFRSGSLRQGIASRRIVTAGLTSRWGNEGRFRIFVRFPSSIVSRRRRNSQVPKGASKTLHRGDRRCLCYSLRRGWSWFARGNPGVGTPRRGRPGADPLVAREGRRNVQLQPRLRVFLFLGACAFASTKLRSGLLRVACASTVERDTQSGRHLARLLSRKSFEVPRT